MFGMILVLALLLAGCRVVKDTAELPGKAVSTVTHGKKEQPKMDPVELQQQLLRFADEFTAGMLTSAESLRRGTNSLERVEMTRWRITFAGSTLAIASGQNAIANLLDMLVLTTMTRTAVEDYWLPNVFGESARPMLEVSRDAEEKIWRLAAPVVKSAQAEELRAAVRTAYEKHRDSEMVFNIRAVGLAGQVDKSALGGGAERPASVFNLLQLDPLAGLDPATREIAQTRLLAERALYVAQHMPLLLRWQTELLSYQLASMPEAGQVLTNLDRFGQTANAITRTAEELPKLVNEQREAAIKQLFDGLATERTNLIASLAADDMKLRPTLVELRQTLDSGNELMKSSDATVKSLDKFMGRFDTGTNAPPPATATNSRPFDILDYATAAKEVTATIKELNTAINSLDNALPKIQKAGDALEATGNRLLTRFLLVGAALVVLLLVGVFLVAVGYRRFAARNVSSNANYRT